MRGRLGFALAAACMLAVSALVGSAWAATEVTPSCPGPGPSTCLFNQTQLESATSVESDEYGEGDQATPPDSQYASPFVIPDGSAWRLTEFDVRGGFVGGNPDYAPTALNIVIYRDNGGQIGEEVLRFEDVEATNGPNYVVTLSEPLPVLQPGKYWFSAQAADVIRNSDVSFYWVWNVEFTPPPLRSMARAVLPTASRALFGIAGTVVPPVTPEPPPACPAISANAAYFKPRRPVKSTRLGVRVRVTASVPSNVTATAKVRLKDGKTVDLGTFTQGVPSFRKFRFPVPAKLRFERGEKVTLLLHTVTTPTAAGNCKADTRDYEIKTKVINIEKSRALK